MGGWGGSQLGSFLSGCFYLVMVTPFACSSIPSFPWVVPQAATGCNWLGRQVGSPGAFPPERDVQGEDWRLGNSLCLLHPLAHYVPPRPSGTGLGSASQGSTNAKEGPVW